MRAGQDSNLMLKHEQDMVSLSKILHSTHSPTSLHLMILSQVFPLLSIQPRLFPSGDHLRRPHRQVVENFRLHTCSGRLWPQTTFNLELQLQVLFFFAGADLSWPEMGMGRSLHRRFTVKQKIVLLLSTQNQLFLRYLLTASSDCVARLWNLKTGEVS